MGPLGKKLLQELRKSPRGNVIDMQTVRDARRFRSELATHQQDMEAVLSPHHVTLMTAFAILSRLGQALLHSRTLHKLAERIENADDEFMPGGPPSSPILDSAFMSWAFMDLGAGPRRESLFGILADIGPALELPQALCDTARLLAQSRLGIYRVKEVGPHRVQLVDLCSGAQGQSKLPQDLASRDPLWLARILVPDPETPEDWIVWGTPYALLDDDAEADWCAYFERIEPDPRKRPERVARHFKAPPRIKLWLEFIVDAYLGVTPNGTIVLSGVPDRPESMPDPSPKPCPTEELRERLRFGKANAMERVRARLMAIADDREESLRRDRIRQALGAPEEPVNAQVEAILTITFEMYGHLDASGRSPLDELAEQSASLPADERKLVEGLKVGWFSAFQVLHVQADEGLHVRDVLRNRRLFIRETLGTHVLEPGDVLSGWILAEADHHSFEGGLLRVPHPRAPLFIDQLKGMRDEFSKRMRHLDWRQRAGLLAEIVVPLFEAQLAPEPPPDVRDKLHEILLERMSSWQDEPIPALGNKTPRQAVRSAPGRKAVAELLANQQALFAANPQTAGIDLSEIWRNLGLEPPASKG